MALIFPITTELIILSVFNYFIEIPLLVRKYSQETQKLSYESQKASDALHNHMTYYLLTDHRKNIT